MKSRKNMDTYKNDGWGLSKKSFESIIKYCSLNDKETIVEFGSGTSTIFFLDYTPTNCKIYSFDHDISHCFSGNNPRVDLKIRKLVAYTDEAYELSFKNKKIEPFKYFSDGKNTREINVFYEIRNNDLPNNIDLVLLDGAHGNGRALSYVHLHDKLNDGAIIIVDDLSHYKDFKDKLSIFNYEVIYEKTNKGKRWEDQINIGIYKINKNDIN